MRQGLQARTPEVKKIGEEVSQN